MDELEFYSARDGVRWRYKSEGNHEVLADGGEGYVYLADAMESAYRVVGIEEPERHAVLAAGTSSIGASRPDGTHVLVIFTNV